MTTLDCGCEWSDDGRRVKHCGKGPAPMGGVPRYIGEPAEMRGPGERLPVDPRAPWECVTNEQVAAWVAADPFVRDGLSRRTQACLAYLETFKPAGLLVASK